MNVRLIWLSSNMQWLRRLESAELCCNASSHADRFLRFLSSEEYDAAVLQLPLSAEVLGKVAEAWSQSGRKKPVILFDPAETLAAGDFPACAPSEWLLLRNADLQTVRTALLQAAEPPPATEAWRSRIVGQSSVIAQLPELVSLVAKSSATVLITGNTGTGKEVLARAIHQASARASGPFVAINCAALPASLLEAELFGHKKGAFTSAAGTRTGLFERANGGTILLDEIGEMPIELQTKLLRVLQEREVLPLGCSDPTPIDIRVLASTNANLRAMCQAGSFRRDLYYRLTVVPVHLPDLKDRPEDVAPLIAHFLLRI